MTITARRSPRADSFAWDRVPQPPMPNAACRDTDLPWIPDKPRNADELRALAADMRTMRGICAGCPELGVCRDFALANYPRVIGLWGGMSTLERREARRAR